jgi:hypothetical protein
MNEAVGDCIEYLRQYLAHLVAGEYSDLAGQAR